MDLVQSFIEKARANPAVIVFPEGHDARIVEAAARTAELGINRPIVLGEPEAVAAVAAGRGVSLKGVRVQSSRDEAAVARYAEVYAAFGGMMVRLGDADGMVGGVDNATASVIQAAALTVGFREGFSTPSSFFIMIVPEFLGEKDKPFIFADCAVNISPSARQLAEIAVASGTNAKALLGLDPRIAFLSFSTKGSAAHADVDKVTEALRIAQGMNSGFEMDGELQADAAIVPRVAAKKVKQSAVAGRANVLVFPDLDAGNMAYKLVQHLGGAKALGPILQGFAKPVNDMSRGATVDDLVAVAAITAVQARG